jgi:hypothetical protein
MMTTDLTEIANKATIGALMIVTEAPESSAFTVTLWERLPSSYRPSKKAFDSAVSLGLIYHVDAITYRFTDIGLAFRAYLKNQIPNLREVEYA